MFATLRYFYVLVSPTVHSYVAMSMVLTFWEADANPVSFWLNESVYLLRNLMYDPRWCIKRLLKYNFLWFLYKINLAVRTVMITLNECLLCAGHCLNSSCALSQFSPSCGMGTNRISILFKLRLIATRWQSQDLNQIIWGTTPHLLINYKTSTVSLLTCLLLLLVDPSTFAVSCTCALHRIPGRSQWVLH